MEIVVRVKPIVTTWRRRRAWFVFLADPQRVEVTEEQYKEISEDQYLTIVKQWNSLLEAKDYSEDRKELPKQELTKKELIQKLKDSWRIEWVDFNPNAKKSDLEELLN